MGGDKPCKWRHTGIYFKGENAELVCWKINPRNRRG